MRRSAPKKRKHGERNHHPRRGSEEVAETREEQAMKPFCKDGEDPRFAMTDRLQLCLHRRRVALVGVYCVVRAYAKTHVECG